MLDSKDSVPNFVVQVLVSADQDRMDLPLENETPPKLAVCVEQARLLATLVACHSGSVTGDL